MCEWFFMIAWDFVWMLIKCDWVIGWNGIYLHAIYIFMFLWWAMTHHDQFSLSVECIFFCFIADNQLEPPWSWDKSNCSLILIRQYQDKSLFKRYYDHYGCKRYKMGWKYVPEIWEYVPGGGRRDVRGMPLLSLNLILYHISIDLGLLRKMTQVTVVHWTHVIPCYTCHWLNT